MNQAQELWWKQAQPDFELFVHLRRTGFHECHSLHFLQMTTEKLSKAYFWRSGLAPPKVHTGFVRFLKALLDREVDLDRIATFLGFKRRDNLDRWVRNIQEVAYSVQNLSLAEARNGPNPEYPWSHERPTHCPVDHRFELWNQLTETGQGRKLIEVIGRAVAQFDQYA